MMAFGGLEYDGADVMLQLDKALVNYIRRPGNSSGNHF